MKKVFLLFLICILIMLGTACSDSAYCYLEQKIPVGEEKHIKNTADNVSINFYIDATGSMSGYVLQRNTEYIKTLGNIFSIEQKLWGINCTASYYKFGTYGIYEYDKQWFTSKSIQKEFYLEEERDKNLSADGGKSIRLFDGINQPFGVLNLEINEKLLNDDNNSDNLYIVTTDLYEQSGIYSYFSDIFAQAFNKDKSGAIFMVQSSFNGAIQNISDDTDEKLDFSDSDSVVKMPFFILVLGDTDALNDYCEALSENLTTAGVEHDYSLFLFNNGFTGVGDEKLIHISNEVRSKTQDETKFNQTYAYSTINAQDASSRFKTWSVPDALNAATKSQVATDSQADIANAPEDELKNTTESESVKKTTSSKQENIKVWSYYAGATDYSRYIMGIPIHGLKGIDSSDSLRVELNLEKCETENIKNGQYSKFLPYEKAIQSVLNAKVYAGQNIPEELSRDTISKYGETDESFIYSVFESKNKELDSGIYKLDFKIYSKHDGNLPDWVIEKNALNADELLESYLNRANNPTGIKVLNLSAIYTSILNNYKTINNTPIFADSIYIIK